MMMDKSIPVDSGIALSGKEAGVVTVQLGIGLGTDIEDLGRLQDGEYTELNVSGDCRWMGIVDIQ